MKLSLVELYNKANIILGLIEYKLNCLRGVKLSLKLSVVEVYNKANIFLGLIEYEMNSLLGANLISVHIPFDLERHLLIIEELN